MAGRRLLLAGTAAWVVGYLAVYLAVLEGQGESSPAWWYVALLVVAAGLLALAAAGRVGRGALVTAAAVLGAATVLALASIGVLLIPALATTAVLASRHTLKRNSTTSPSAIT